jgi:DNA-binding CsgD family transcriptional regulator
MAVVSELERVLSDRRLLERGHELTVLSRAAALPGSLAIVEGPAGIGKTAIVDAVVSMSASADAPSVLLARASELERNFAFGVVKQLFEPRLSALSAEELERVFAGAARPAQRIFADEPVTDFGTDDVAFAVLRGLHELSARLAASSHLAVVVDDAHWADRPSLRFLAFLGKRLDRAALSLVISVREGEPNAPADLLDELRLDRRAMMVKPRPLSRDAIARAVRATVAGEVDDKFVASCHRASAGNPLYLRELLLAVRESSAPAAADLIDRLRDSWPRSIARYVLRRVERIGPDAPSLAAAMAILGDGASLRLAGRLAGIDPGRAARLARALSEVEILSSEDPLAFVHPVVRLAVERDISPDRREDLHSEAAKLLLSERTDHDGACAHLLALGPGERSWVVDALRQGARVALSRGAPEVACSYLSRALSEPPADHLRVRVLCELALAEEHVGSQAAIEHLREALDDARAEERGEVALQLAGTLASLSRSAEAVEVLTGELARAVGPQHKTRLLVALSTAGIVEPTPAVIDALKTLAREVPPYPEGQAVLAVAALSAVAAGRPAEQGLALAERALAMGPLRREDWGPAGAMFWAVGALLSTLIECDAFDRARATIEHVLGEVSAAGHVRGLWQAHHHLALLEQRLGRLAAAEANARVALEIVLGAGHSRSAWPVYGLTETLLDTGALNDAVATIELMPPEPWPSHVSFIYARVARGRLRCALRRTDAGLEDLSAAGRELERIGCVGPAPTYWRAAAALALHESGRVGEARRLAGEELERARAFGTKRATGLALRAAGAVAPADQQVALLEESVSVLEASPAILQRGRSLVELGAALRRRGQRRVAREPLRRGLDLAVRCGAAPLVERARQELLASGARPRRDAIAGRDALTPSEARIARLAAEGMTNRQIAGSLFLSPKTVEMHLGRVYRKLGIDSRRMLADHMVED